MRKRINFKYTILLLFLLPNCVQAQLKFVSQDNIFVKWNGGSDSKPLYLVLDEQSDEVFIENTPGRKLISENQFHILRWGISDAIGDYYVAFNRGTSPYESIGIGLDIGNAGSASGVVDFSTYGTGQDNLPLPVGVSSLGHVNSTTPVDGSWVYDRYWFVDAQAYTSKPEGVLSFNYAASEFTGNLLANSSSMLAQQFDPTTDAWGGATAAMYGTDNLSGIVSGISLNQNNFTSTWTLVDENNPLPIDLLSFDVSWTDEEQNKARIEWVTATEINNEYFDVEKSKDGLEWVKIGRVNGQGTTNNQTMYSFFDNAPDFGINYYRLKQVDFDGASNHTQIKSLLKSKGGDSFVLHPNPADNFLNISFTNAKKEKFDITIIDNLGKVIKVIVQNEDENLFVLDVNTFAKGIYMVRINQEDFTDVKKFVVN